MWGGSPTKSRPARGSILSSSGSSSGARRVSFAAFDVTRGVVNGSHWWRGASTTVIVLSVTMSVCGFGDSETSYATRRRGVVRFTLGVCCDLGFARPARNHRGPYAFHAQTRARQGVIGRPWPVGYRTEETERVETLRRFGVRKFT